MINEILFMNGYGAFVWSSFIFTLSSFFILYSVIKLQLIKEQKKFDTKFKNLSSEKVELAKKQETYRELLPNTSVSKI
jgi:heme exporter protein D|tara:strand:- start:431 stop:664 length:234 start_codon:yes stop_codon:yes gene_type:complete